MIFQNITNGMTVNTTNDAIDTKGSLVTYVEVDSGSERSMSRELFTKRFVQVSGPLWTAVVRKDDDSGLFLYDLKEGNNGAGTCTGFGTEWEARYYADRTIETMNSSN